MRLVLAVWLALVTAAHAQPRPTAFTTATGVVSPTPQATITALNQGVSARQLTSLQYQIAHPSPTTTCSNQLFGTVSITGSISGSVLTVSAVTQGNLFVGQTISYTGSPLTLTIASLGTGTGGTGTYNLSQSLTVASSAMTAAIAVSTYSCHWEMLTLALELMDLDARTNTTADLATANGYIATAVAGIPTDYNWAGLQAPGVTASFTASASGQTLTVTGVSAGFLVLGQTISFSGAPPGLTIIATGPGATYTGNGTVGTYEISSSVTASSQTMTAAFVPTALTIPTDFWHYDLAQKGISLIYGFGSGGTIKANAMTSANEAPLRALFATWASTSCPIANVHVSTADFAIWGSENHDQMYTQTCQMGAWAAANTTALNGTTWIDYAGNTAGYAAYGYPASGSPAPQAAAQYAAWTARGVYWLKTIVTNGTTTEMMASTYAKYTLNTVYVWRDFSPDATTAMLANQFLNVWWAEWAQESVDGNHGGADNRNYPNVSMIKDPLLGVGPWVYLGGYGGLSSQSPAGMNNPLYVSMLISPYRIPDVVADIALDKVGRGSYSVITRSMQSTNAGAQLDTANYYHRCIGLACQTSVRYAWVTPEFVMGSTYQPLSAYLTLYDQAGSQNIWNGVVSAGTYNFSAPGNVGGSGNQVPLTRVAIQPVGTGTGNRSCYNCAFAVQSGPIMIVQGVPSTSFAGVTYSHDFGYMAINIGAQCNPYVEGDPTGHTSYVAVQCGSAYIYIQDALGTAYSWATIPTSAPYYFVTGIGAAMQVGGASDPIIVEAAGVAEYPTLAAFVAAVQASPIVLNTSTSTLTVDGPGPGMGHLVYNYAIPPTATPSVDGGALNFAPTLTMRSPFVNGNGCVVNITKSGRSLTQSFC